VKSPYQSFFKNAERASQGKSAKATFTLNPSVKDEVNIKSRTVKNSKMTAEAVIQRELKARIASRSKGRAEKAPGRAKMPVFPVICLLAALVFGAVGYFNPEYSELVISKFESLSGLSLQLSSASAKDDAAHEAKPDGKTGQQKSDISKNKEANSAEPKTESKASAANSAGLPASSVDSKKPDLPLDTSQWNSEEISFFKKLSERKKQLDQRESELSKLEEELQRRKEELESRVQQLEKMRKEISTVLNDRVKQDQERVDKLVQVYSSMKAPQAAKLLEEINEDLAVEVLDKMKKKAAADILNMMDTKKVRKLSEMMVGYGRKPASEEGAKQ
jgi:flagellar motility protein MotE (MotC chaperone)